MEAHCRGNRSRRFIANLGDTQTNKLVFSRARRPKINALKCRYLSKKMAACSLSALPMTATAQAAFSTHDGKELTPPQFLRMHCCIHSVPEPDQNRK
jgi:hypothetical protein